MLDNKVCNCGGTYINKKGRWVCDSCGRPMPQILDSRANQLLAVAEGKFAQEKFIEAEELYADIVKSFPDCYPAYWGLTLAKHGIKYVDDLRTGTKVATCWAPEISSIIDDKNYKKVLAIAPSDEKQYYESQGGVIENIRKEWQEKAKKIKPYDVFICFKDTDDSTGGRTQDSIELSDLYNNLTRDKYNVFFSRYSLEGITAENYEPYIFQALSTAKVMIVYGSKEEYFDSTWMKNEWTRFLHKIADGQKQKNSLLPVVKDCAPSALPPRLRALQVLDAGKNTFYSDLTRYIDKVLASSEDVVELQRSKIKFDKRQSVSRSQARKIQSRALQVEDVEIVSAQGEQLMKVINSFVQQKQYERAEKFCDAWIKSNPANYRDLEELVNTILISEQIKLARKYVKYLVENAPDRKKPKLWNAMLADGYTDVNEWAEYVSQKHVSYEYMQMLLPLVSKNEICLVSAFYDGIAKIDTFSEEVKSMILYVLEFETEKSKKSAFINQLIEKAISDTTDNFAYFEFIISLLDNAKYKSALKSFVDAYADADNLKALQQVLPDAASYFLQALQKALPLVEGELYFRVQCALIRILFELGYYTDAVNETQKMLGYAENEEIYSKVLSDTLEYAIKNITEQNVEFADEEVFRMLGFLKGDKDEEEYYFGELAEICLDMRYKKGAERYAKLLLGCGSEGKYNGYYYLMLLTLDCYNDDEVARLTVDIADTEGYNNWLANCDEEQISLATDYLNTIDQLKIKHQKAREKQLAEKKADKAKKAANNRSKFFAGLLIVIALVSSVVSIMIATVYLMSPNKNYTYSGLILALLTMPTIGGLCVAVSVVMHNKSSKDKKSKIGINKICYFLIIPLLIVNVLVFALDATRYKYVDDIFYVKENLNGAQTLYYIDLDNRPDSNMVVIPSTVEKISPDLIKDKYPNEIYIPKSVKEIKAETFYGCSKLTIYCEAESKPEGWERRWNCYKYNYECRTYWGYKLDKNESGDGENADYIFDKGIKYTIENKDELSVTISRQPSSLSGNVSVPSQIEYKGKTYKVTNMVESAFQDTKISSISLPDTILDIPFSAFYNCTNLSSVTMSNSVTSIGDSAFNNCTSLSSVNIPAGITYIGELAFVNCEKLKNLNIQGNSLIIGYGAFSRTGIITLLISGTVERISREAFYHCILLSSVTLAEGVKRIDQSAFSYCSALKKIIIPESVQQMQMMIFDTNISNLTIYCRSTSKPNNWDNSWNEYQNGNGGNSKHQVVWGYKGK